MVDHSGVDLKVQSIMDPYIDAVKEISPKFESITGASVTVEGFGYDGLHEKQLLLVLKMTVLTTSYLSMVFGLENLLRQIVSSQLRIFGLLKAQINQ